MQIYSEFVGLRSQLYTESLAEYPHAREDDLQFMRRYLNPQPGEHILGFSEGNGFFCQEIAEAIGISGSYLLTDPSQDQLDSLLKKALPVQVIVQQSGAETLEVPSNFYDKIWSFGGFHHCQNQTEAFQRIYKALKPKGKLVIADVFQGSSLAKHFDKQVARYCLTGHEVKFMSDEFARTLCYVGGFLDKNVDIVDLPQKWRFKTEYEIGAFVYKFHAMTKLPGSEIQKIQQVFEGCKEILGIEYRENMYELNWPMKAIIAIK
jgi:ubiquinone/menaquinone biosynthesis C-methylase UbiE